MIANKLEERIHFLDVMRVVACFMVILVHSCEFFIVMDDSGVGLRSQTDGWWVSIIDSAFRCSVPLFVMISSYLLVPIRGSVTMFFKKRFLRVIVPFAIWSLLYATLPWLWGAMSGQEVAASVSRLAYNFNDAAGHLWFVYMLIGVYLIMPVLSPWLEKAGRKAELYFLLLWSISTFFPYIRACCGEVWGECSWNEFHALFYFSGFIGYVVLAHYIRRYLDWSAKKQLIIGLLFYAVGYCFTAIAWYESALTATEMQDLELFWGFCTPNVAMMGFGAFIVIRSLFLRTKRVSRIVTEASRLSYGIYLMHIFILNAIFRLLEGRFSTPLTIVVIGVATFFCSFVLAKLLSYLPKSKYIVG
ncbi:MAG: acyltransferase [Bacteroidales bacterium]|nr:acyltransferase [Bacteroidales bacterium]